MNEPAFRIRPDTQDRLLTEAEAIELLGLGDRPNPKAALRWLVRTRRVAHVDLARGIRRFKASDLAEYIDRQRVPAKE